MSDRARLGMTAALCVLLPFGPAVAHAAPSGNQPAIAQEQMSDLPQGLWGLLGLLGLFGLLGLARRGPKRNAKNPLAGYGGEDEMSRGRHQAPPAPRAGSPMDILPGAQTDRNPQVERPPLIDQPAMPRADAAIPHAPNRPAMPREPMPEPGSRPAMPQAQAEQIRPYASYTEMAPPAPQAEVDAPLAPADAVPFPDYTAASADPAQRMPAEEATPYPEHSGSAAAPQSAPRAPAMPYGAYAEVPAPAQPVQGELNPPRTATSYRTHGEIPPAAHQVGPRVDSPMDTAPTTPTPVQYRHGQDAYPQTDQDPPPQRPVVPQQQGGSGGPTFAGLPRYPETTTPDPGPVDAGPRHRR